MIIHLCTFFRIKRCILEESDIHANKIPSWQITQISLSSTWVSHKNTLLGFGFQLDSLIKDMKKTYIKKNFGGIENNDVDEFKNLIGDFPPKTVDGIRLIRNAAISTASNATVTSEKF